MKQRITRSIIFIMTIGIMMSLCASPLFAFGDVTKRHWSYEAVNYVEEQKFMTGTGNNMFSPELTTTRGTFVMVLANMKGIDRSLYTQSSFTDVDINKWYGPAIQWAYEEKIVSGFGETFEPDSPVTREQMLKILYDYSKYIEKDVTVSDPQALGKFSDGNSVSDWAKEATIWGVNNSIISGMSATTLVPQGLSTRAQISKILMVYVTGQPYTFVPVQSVPGQRTLKNYLTIALEPVGNCMYIWGGGWVGADTNRIGVNPLWKSWSKQQGADYDYDKTRWKYGYGLDCSGYVGWVTYNMMNTRSGGSPYVIGSRVMAKTFADTHKFGSYTDRTKVTNYKVGDIMSTTCTDGCGHVWISLGQCADGSVVLVHSSPRGVRIAGTLLRELPKLPDGSDAPFTQDYATDATRLAERYMSEYYPDWHSRFPYFHAPVSYMGHYSQMRWNTGAGGKMSDPDGMQNKSPQEVLEILIGD